MAFIRTIQPDEASGPLKEVYDAELKHNGKVDNGVRAFSLRPATYAAWQQLRDGVQSNMDLRRYELVTLAAASSLRCSYCTLAHGFSDAEILDIALAAAARSFLSKVLDAVGAEPDGWFMDLQPELRQALSVGRPFG
jgi:alkylhydroperoxidase family enzyme